MCEHEEFRDKVAEGRRNMPAKDAGSRSAEDLPDKLAKDLRDRLAQELHDRLARELWGVLSEELRNMSAEDARELSARELWDKLTRGFEELARAIGLKSGSMRVTVTEGWAAKIEAFQYARACCQRRKMKEWDVPQGHCELKMRAAPGFVTKYLEILIVFAVGRFGYIEAHLTNGRTTELLVKIGRQPPGTAGVRNSGFPLP